MKILFFSTYFYPYISGITTSPYSLLSHLAKKNNVSVLTFPHLSHLSNSEQINGIQVIRMPYFFRLSKGFISPQSLFFFLRHVRRSDLVILNIPNFEGLFLAFISFLFRKKIYSLFNCKVFLGQGIMSSIINYGLNLSIYIQLLLSEKILTYTKDYVTNISMPNIFLKKTHYVFPVISQLAIDINYQKKLKKIKGNAIWLGFIGRVAREKGIEYMINTVKLVQKTYPQLELIIAGPSGKQVIGEDGYYTYVLQALKKSKIPYRLLRKLTEKCLGAFYRSIDLLILPSINKTEAFSIVQVEAMLLGTPVVVTNLPGVRIPTQLTKMGKVVEPKNITQLANAIIYILQNKKLFTNKKLIENAASIFNIKRTLKAYQDIIEE
ncbi:hypothetical protein A2334_03260 [Candidatus Roizmanbacteria bacterium RIFOXYB2_FULL_38_10]|uniref:Glycosyl transferase family 1 domain-containing protein n=1 Tax=Candidatus Roizmanbacteria bacterium RIFOXYD1_FULL_38_12 TaxID=1802093 RepID=A0A1F7L149_9BACT|nr:MAG: hypothetical protein A3K47_03590 [Candidatus Roizmanbacteria bacterium RIFOXYA2_FULL_38_14]OGK63845.1 MAG: hypothetical protein A3K27_03590 [Candidatus Roizmanbacteria bacterium RIFOXYA1_FULL_37_12]OGK65691.1 MAG: hypothetical protein A3K38_03590 [Candidatus Roizmanbacteria bacterium RIFOXYB1_FULL_40_23]OGK67422.1 MAG: hypothetical protein A2334_03260 [Candidatus Roizmanbacteria bacterium RIFOXYB2_FULL_38_10]OGK70096.1 MAG: hypothetical protein A3K21_03595 [Candidatus Roizmanbacteria ba